MAALGSAAALPVAARAQQRRRMRRIGVFMPAAANDPESMSRITALIQGLQEAGWTDGRNVQIEFRWGSGEADQYRKIATELIAAAPDVVVALGTLTVGALRRASRRVPVIFVSVSDPVGGGIVESLARPGGNAIGFAAPEYGTSGKYLELLKEIAPQLTRAAVTRDPGNTAGTAQFAAIQTVASSFKIELRPFDITDAGDIERAITTFARQPNGGLIVTASAPAQLHRDLIIRLAAAHRLPAIYPLRFYVINGGLISYGFDVIDSLRRAAGYVDRVLKGEKPADLPVQAPTKYELVINLKTAKGHGVRSSSDSARSRRRGHRMTRINRRELIAFAGAAWPIAARGEQLAQKLLTVGFLGSGTILTGGQEYAALLQRLHELGWVEGRNVRIEVRWAEGRIERFAQIAAEFVAEKVDLIVTTGGVVPTVKQATSTIPIVFAVANDPVGSGYVASLAQPGGNITGLSQQSADTVGKRIGFLRDVVPGLRRLAIISNAGGPGNLQEVHQVQGEAEKVGIEVTPFEIKQAEEIAHSFEALKDKAQALYVVNGPVTNASRIRINTIAVGGHLPAIYGERQFVEIGGLMSYGPNAPNMFRRAADYVDKILRGAKPGDLPVEQPTKFDLTINLTTAKTIGVTIPDRLLALADEVIE